MKEEQTYSLLIYWGDDVDLYLIPDKIVDEHRKVLEQCHSQFINSDDTTKSMQILNSLLCEVKEYVPEEYQEYACRWAEYWQALQNPLVGKQISAVYFSGWVP